MKIIQYSGGLGNQMFQIALYFQLVFLKQNVVLESSFFYEEELSCHLEIERIFFNGHNKLEKLNIVKNKRIILFFRRKLKILLKKIKIIKLLRNIKKLKKETKDFYDIIKDKNYLYEKNIQKLKKYYKIQNFTNEKGIYFVIGEYKKEILIEKKNMIILGCPQSEKYFINIKENIKKLYRFPEIMDEKNKNIANKIKYSNSISLHIRRGDYLKEKGLGNLAPLFYYKAAIKYILKEVKNPVFFIFSNDIKWCKENLKLDYPIYYINWNKGTKSFRDMQLMSLCKHNIIPNSTFSWWGAWLNDNPNKIVIAPERWFNLEVQQIDRDIIPKEWIKIRNY